MNALLTVLVVLVGVVLLGVDLDETLSETDSINTDIRKTWPCSYATCKAWWRSASTKNTAVVFPAPLMSTIGELGAFLARETTACAAMPATEPAPPGSDSVRLIVDLLASENGAPNGRADVQR